MLEALARVYDATLLPQPWPAIMATLGALLGTGKVMFTRIDRTFPSESVTEVIGVAPDMIAALKNRDLREDQLWHTVSSIPTGTVFRSSELVPGDAYQRGPLYHGIAVPAGLEFVLGIIVENTTEFFSNLSFMQAGRDFTDGQKALLGSLAPHLRTASRLSLRIALGDSGRREALLSFDRARQAMIVLDRSGYAIYSNAAAARVLQQADGVTLKFGRFLFNSIPTQAEFERVVRMAMSSQQKDIAPMPHVLRVPRQGPGSPYAMSIIPLTNSADLAVLPDGAGCMILLYDLESGTRLPVARLAWLYRLTPAEARVCDSLFRAGSVDAVATDLSLTRNTVRSHLKSVYAKFGVATQGQLMQRLANSVRMDEGIDRAGPGSPQAS